MNPKTLKPRFNGDVLILPEWSYAARDARVPHRRRILAFYPEQKRIYFVCSNLKRTLFWVHATGPGFAGDRSRHSLTCATKDEALAETWIAAVASGKVCVA